MQGILGCSSYGGTIVENGRPYDGQSMTKAELREFVDRLPDGAIDDTAVLLGESCWSHRP